MVQDREGFLQPVIDQEYCNDCDACLEVCPILHVEQNDFIAEPEVYACWQKDEAVRFRSASGGAFSALAKTILDEGGIVYGAAYDKNMKVVHVGFKDKGELHRLRGSKYVQSDTCRVFSEIREFIQNDKKVLFSGTPCQVAGLKMFIGKQDNNLVTCDLLCKGVPSPGLFSKYVTYLEKIYQAKLVHLNPRHKAAGWEIPSTKATFDNAREVVLSGIDNAFMYGFASNILLRESCFRCPYSRSNRKGDISLGDFWGIGDDDAFHHDTRNGISLVLINTEQGRKTFLSSSESLFSERRSLSEAQKRQIALMRPVQEPVTRKAFFDDSKRFSFLQLATKYLMDYGIKRIIKSVFPRTWIFRLRRRLKTFCVRQEKTHHSAEG